MVGRQSVTLSQDAESRRVVVELRGGSGRVGRFTLQELLVRRLTQRDDIPTGCVTIHIELPTGSLDAPLRVDGLRTPVTAAAPSSRSGIRAPKVSLRADPDITPSAAPAAAGKRGASDVRFAMSREEAFQDVGRWLSMDGWVRDRVWLTAEMEIEQGAAEPQRPLPPLPPPPPSPPPPRSRQLMVMAVVILVLAAGAAAWALWRSQASVSTERDVVQHPQREQQPERQQQPPEQPSQPSQQQSNPLPEAGGKRPPSPAVLVPPGCTEAQVVLGTCR